MKLSGRALIGVFYCLYAARSVFVPSDAAQPVCMRAVFPAGTRADVAS